MSIAVAISRSWDKNDPKDAQVIYEAAKTSIGLPIPVDAPAIPMFRLVIVEARSLIRQRDEIEVMADQLLAASKDYARLARTPAKARQALAGMSNVEQGELDLLDPTSIDGFAASVLAKGRPLHILVNNAGTMAVPLGRDARGYEHHFAANHLGRFKLTARLWSALRRAGGARVVTLSSGAHRRAPVDFDNPHFRDRPYDKWIAYGQSKTANVLFTVALDRRGEGEGIRAFAVHPGRIETDLQRAISLAELQALGFRDAEGAIPPEQRGLYKSPAQGAATTVWCAAHPRLDDVGGVYCENADIAVAVPADHAAMNGVLPWATDPEAAERLWTASEKMAGVIGPG